MIDRIDKPDKDGKIFRGVDANGKQIRTTEEYEERQAMKLQIWQRAHFAKEMGFDPDTKDPAELAAIDWKYEKMLREWHEWNNDELRKMDNLALAEIKRMGGLITEEEYNEIINDAINYRFRY